MQWLCFFLFAFFWNNNYQNLQSLFEEGHYREVVRITDSLIRLKGKEDKLLYYMYFASLYRLKQIGNFNEEIGRSFLEHNYNPEELKVAQTYFMTAEGYRRKHNISFAVYSYLKAGVNTRLRDTVVSLLVHLFHIKTQRYLIPDLNWLIASRPLNVYIESGFPEEIKGDFLNGLKLTGITFNPKLNKDYKKFSLIIGPFHSASIRRVYGEYAAHWQPAIFPLAMDVNIHLEQPVFPFNYRYLLELKKGLDFLAQELGYMNFAIFYQEDDPISLSATVYLKKAIQTRYNLVYSKPFTKDSLWLIQEIDSTTGENWDAVFVLGRDVFTLTLISTFRREVPELTVFTFSDFRWKAFTGKYRGMDGTFFAAPPFTLEEMTGIMMEKREFKEKYYQKYGLPASPFAERGYDVGKLISKFLSLGKTLNRGEIWNFLYNLGYYQGISGYFVFKDDPDLLKIYKFYHGRFKPWEGREDEGE